TAGHGLRIRQPDRAATPAHFLLCATSLCPSVPGASRPFLKMRFPCRCEAAALMAASSVGASDLFFRNLMMSRSQPATAQKADTATAAAALSVARYAMLWRWHFYAALFVMPLLIVLGITGTIYLYKPQVEAAIYKSQLYVAPQASPRLPHQILYEIAQDSTPGGAPILTAEIHNAPDRSAQFTYSDPVHGKSSIFLNPYSGQVLAQMPTLKANATYWIGLARQIHRGLLLGKTGEIVMELA